MSDRDYRRMLRKWERSNERVRDLEAALAIVEERLAAVAPFEQAWLDTRAALTAANALIAEHSDEATRQHERAERAEVALLRIRSLVGSLRFAAPEMAGYWFGEIESVLSSVQDS